MNKEVPTRGPPIDPLDTDQTIIHYTGAAMFWKGFLKWWNENVSGEGVVVALCIFAFAVVFVALAISGSFEEEASITVETTSVDAVISLESDRDLRFPFSKAPSKEEREEIGAALATILREKGFSVVDPRWVETDDPKVWLYRFK